MNGTTLNVTEHMPKNIKIMKKSGSVADLESYNQWGDICLKGPYT
jgi:hypothetical protein